MMRTRKILALITLSMSAVFYALGLYFPLLATKKQILGIVLTYKDVRLFDSVKMFYEHQDYLLAGIIFIFTIVLPIIKYFDLFNRLLNWIHFPPKVSHFLHKIDKWSMIDVFLVALLLLNFKMDSNIIVMRLKMGTTFIALSVVFRMIAAELLTND